MLLRENAGPPVGGPASGRAVGPAHAYRRFHVPAAIGPEGSAAKQEGPAAEFSFRSGPFLLKEEMRDVKEI